MYKAFPSILGAKNRVKVEDFYADLASGSEPGKNYFVTIL